MKAFDRFILTTCFIASILSIGLSVMAMRSVGWPTDAYRGQMVVALQLPPDNYQAPKIDYQALQCMTENIFFEARGESDEGKAMVGVVVIQRMKSPHFPDTVCGVVHQAITDNNGFPIKNLCQFSWYCDGRTDSINLHNEQVADEWIASQKIARAVLSGKYKKLMVKYTGVTHYHADYSDPYWAHNKNYRMVIRVGSHMFYRWKKADDPQIAVN